MSNGRPRANILVADDNASVRALLTRTLTAEGYAVWPAVDGNDALNVFDTQVIDVVLSDIDMPGCNGIELLQALRLRDPDLPILLITGAPRLETAMAAVEFSATHYLTKPFDLARLQQTVRRAVQAGRLAKARRNLSDLTGLNASSAADLDALGMRLNAALSSAYLVYQPIVRWSSRSTFAYEALIRSTEPLLGMPGAMFDAADRLDRVADIGRHARGLCQAPADDTSEGLLFVNVHTEDLADDRLYAQDASLTKMADRVILEVTERARIESVADVSERIGRLRKLGFRVAVDDLGAGYAGLTSFAALEPDFIKLDRALVEEIHRSSTKMGLVEAMIRVSADLGVQVIGEGVETEGERDALVSLGCDLLQGFLFARPQLPWTVPAF